MLVFWIIAGSDTIEVKFALIVEDGETRLSVIPLVRSYGLVQAQAPHTLTRLVKFLHSFTRVNAKAAQSLCGGMTFIIDGDTPFDALEIVESGGVKHIGRRHNQRVVMVQAEHEFKVRVTAEAGPVRNLYFRDNRCELAPIVELVVY